MFLLCHSFTRFCSFKKKKKLHTKKFNGAFPIQFLLYYHVATEGGSSREVRVVCEAVREAVREVREALHEFRVAVREADSMML